MTSKDFGFGTQIRKSPFFNSTVKWGAKEFSVYNHMYIPRDFGDPEQNFWNLINNAILCDVSVERQVEIIGPDAAKFTQLLTPRNLTNLSIGQCKYVLITKYDGVILNDPVLLKLDENHFWLSLGDSDILLWAQGVAINSGLDVTIKEPDVSPLQLQGPKSIYIMKKLFGNEITKLKYYWHIQTKLNDIPLVVSRTGWSTEIGFELFLRDASKGDTLWELIMEAGKEFDLKPGHTSSIRRIEAGMLSYQADANINNNPFELGLDRLVDLDNDNKFIGKEALIKIKKEGITKKQVGIIIDCDPLNGPNTIYWPILKNNKRIGNVTSAIYSPRLKKNIALGIVSIAHSQIGNNLNIQINNKIYNSVIVKKPFYDPNKNIPSKNIDL